MNASAAEALDVDRLIAAYFTRGHGRVKFGTSGHRGSSALGTFNENHVLAICQAICDLRANGGPLFLGMDTHALSAPAFATALEVFACNGVDVVAQEGGGFTPTPVLSHAVLTYNAGRRAHMADAVILTPSHNPPADGGLKYNPPSGGPAGSGITGAIEARANALLADGLRGVQRSRRGAARQVDWQTAYIEDLDRVLDMDAISKSGLKAAVDPMGGAAVRAWAPIAERYCLDLEVVNKAVDPAFSFMPPDHDGKIRMDCSSPDAMANLIRLADGFDIAFGNDPDVDRHGIVTRAAGLMNPNHYLSVAADYLFAHRSAWPVATAVAKTLVTSAMIDRVASSLKRPLVEVPVGFKWFVDGLSGGAYGLAVEESAGATFLRQEGSVWTTDKDGIVMALLAAEITAVTERDPSEHYRTLEERHGRAYYRREDAPATDDEKAVLCSLSPAMVEAETLAGDKIIRTLTRAPGNDAPIGGLKVETGSGWFAARPSGTEAIYKIYGESFRSADHLNAILEEARALVAQALEAAGI